MSEHEARIAALEKARHDIEDSLVVISTLEARQSKLLREQAEYLASHETRLQQQAELNQGIDQRIDKLVSAIGALIGKMPDTERRK